MGLSLYFPPLCLLCGRWDAVFREPTCCLACWQSLQRPRYLSPGVRVYSAGDYSGSLRLLITRAKFKADPVAASLLCRFMVESAESLPIREAERITSIPPDRTRLRKRGIDLPGLLARKLAKRHGIPYERDLLVRIRNTPSQRSLSRAERLLNLRHAFRAGIPAHPGRVLVVDDVYTTGATARAAVRALRKGGFRAVDFLVAAAAP